MTDERPVMVTVYAVAYNQAKYIRQALDGIINQKTNFRFEILVHDDASTDGTSDIIREYEANYSELIRAVIQKENIFSRHITRTKNFLLQLTRGKYVAFCECDDFWTDPFKLQKQFDVMESNLKSHFCVAKVMKVAEDGVTKIDMHPDFALDSGLIQSEDFLRMAIKYSFQTSSYFFREEDFRKYINDRPEFAYYMNADTAYLLFFGTLGPVCYLDDLVSCYRWHSKGSWTNGFNGMSAEGIRAYYEKFIDGRNKFDAFTNFKYHEVCIEHINYMNDRMEYLIAERNKDYKTMIQGRLTKFHPQWRWYDYTYAWLMAYCPGLMALLRSLKKLLKGKDINDS